MSNLRPLSLLTTLKELDLSDCPGVRTLQPITTLVRLTKLAVAGCAWIPPSEFEHLRALPSLDDLALSITEINDLGSIPRSVTKLNMFLCKSVTAEGYESLTSLTSLQKLNLACNVNFDDTRLRLLSRSLTGLTSLNLSSCKTLTDGGFASLSALVLLNDLNVGGTKFGDISLHSVSHLANLKNLALYYCKSLTTQGFRSTLSSLTSLETLDARNMDVSEPVVLAALCARLPFLKTFKL